MKNLFIGIDPGNSGSIACLDGDDNFKIIKLNGTEHDIFAEFREHIAGTKPTAVIEKVHAMPKQGTVSTFTFGRSYGFCIGLLTALQIPYEFVTPMKWQKEMGCLSRGDKNITKAAAQRMFAGSPIRITHAIADAMLVAAYCRKTI